MKKLFFALCSITLLLSSCSSTPFTPNTDNDLLVGKWNIDHVENDAALVSGTEMISSLLEDRFVQGHVFNFEKGANFQLNTSDNKMVTSGKYAIGAENHSLQLQIEGTVYSYDLNNKKENTYEVVSTTAGESINLHITKK